VLRERVWESLDVRDYIEAGKVHSFGTCKSRVVHLSARASSSSIDETATDGEVRLKKLSKELKRRCSFAGAICSDRGAHLSRNVKLILWPAGNRRPLMSLARDHSCIAKNACGTPSPRSSPTSRPKFVRRSRTLIRIECRNL
jgi:hypothetical protein